MDATRASTTDHGSVRKEKKRAANCSPEKGKEMTKAAELIQDTNPKKPPTPYIKSGWADLRAACKKIMGWWTFSRRVRAEKCEKL